MSVAGSCWGGGGVQGECERRIEVFFVKNKKIKKTGSGWGVRVDVKEEVMFL